MKRHRTKKNSDKSRNLRRRSMPLQQRLSFLSSYLSSSAIFFFVIVIIVFFTKLDITPTFTFVVWFFLIKAKNLLCDKQIYLLQFIAEN